MRASTALMAQNTSVCMQCNPLAGLTMTSPLIGHSRLNTGNIDCDVIDGSDNEDLTSW